jgi:hypothetical protein
LFLGSSSSCCWLGEDQLLLSLRCLSLCLLDRRSLFDLLLMTHPTHITCTRTSQDSKIQETQGYLFRFPSLFRRHHKWSTRPCFSSCDASTCFVLQLSGCFLCPSWWWWKTHHYCFFSLLTSCLVPWISHCHAWSFV